MICKKLKGKKNIRKEKETEEDEEENKVMMTDEEERMIWFNGRRNEVFT